jgi:hypothetical protein
MNRFITSSAKGNELIMPKLPYTTFSHSLGQERTFALYALLSGVLLVVRPLELNLGAACTPD